MKSITFSLSLVFALLFMLLTVAAVSASDDTGQTVYAKTCGACHNSGVMGAPKLGDKAAWASRIKEGLDELTEDAIEGEDKMPPRGGNSKLSDAEVKAAVQYMMDNSQ